MIELWYSFKHRVIPKIIAFFAKGLLKLLMKTVRLVPQGVDQFVAATRQQRCLLALWHQQLPIVPELLHHLTPNTRYAALVSRSQDGEILASLAESYRHGRAIRVAHNKKIVALNTATDAVIAGNDILVITPDGPRGPSRHAKGGIYHIAKRADAAIVPLSWQADHYWELNSWDRMRFPRPFSTIYVRFGAPLTLSSNSNQREELRKIEEAINANGDETEKMARC